MPKTKITLAEKIIEIDSLYDQVVDLCENYLCNDDREPDIKIISTEEKIAAERDVEDSGEYSDGYIETLSVYREIAERMLDFDTFLMHGSVVGVGDEAFMFSASSGVGKTTRTVKWLEQIENSFVVNGDKPLLKVCDDKILACGTPWSGKEHMNTNIIVPLKSIVILERNEKTSIEEISFGDAFLLLFKQTYKPNSPDLMIKTINLLKKTDGKIKFYKYRMNLENTNMVELYNAIR